MKLDDSARALIGPGADATLVSLARSLAFDSDRPRPPLRLLGVTVSQLSDGTATATPEQPRLDFG